MFSRLAYSTRAASKLTLSSKGLAPVSALNNQAFGKFVAQFHAGAPLKDEESTEAIATPEPSLWDTLQQPMIAGPALGLLSIGAIGNDIYIFNEETQLLGLFTLFVGTIATMGGDAIGKGIDEQTGAILAEINEQEDAVIEQVELMLSKTEQFISTQEDAKTILQLQKDLIPGILDAKTQEARLELSKQIEGMLQHIALAEERTRDSLKSTLIANATESVSQAVQTKEARATALDEALSVVGGKELSSDVVGNLYADFFSKYAAQLEADAAKPFKADVDDSVIASTIRSASKQHNLDLSNAEVHAIVDQAQKELPTVGDAALYLQENEAQA